MVSVFWGLFALIKLTIIISFCSIVVVEKSLYPQRTSERSESSHDCVRQDMHRERER